MSTITPPTILDYIKPAPRVLLLGEPGTGKTFSSILAGEYCNLRIIFTENSMRTLYPEKGQTGIPQALRDRVDKTINWAFCPGASTDQGFTALADMARQVAQLDFQGMQNLPADRSKTKEYLKMVGLVDEFRADNGAYFGKISTWGKKDALVLDSLSGFNMQCQRLVVGAKPIMSMPQWQLAMNLQMGLLNQLLTGAPCGVIMTAHLEKEINEVDGSSRNFASALGKKNGPQMGRFFDEVVECVIKGDEFGWRTKSSQTALKTRDLPRVDFMKPDWSILFGKEKLPPI